jgi:hypothetical protein
MSDTDFAWRVTTRTELRTPHLGIGQVTTDFLVREDDAFSS